MNYERFITAQEGDFKGRTLEDIWGFSDAEIEYTHDFIQINFPTVKFAICNEQSAPLGSGFRAPGYANKTK